MPDTETILNSCACSAENFIIECSKYAEHIALLEQTIDSQKSTITIMIAFLSAMLMIFIAKPIWDNFKLNSLNKRINKLKEQTIELEDRFKNLRASKIPF